jgi:ubiquinone biosynthesis monooxygenase Coq7
MPEQRRYNLLDQICLGLDQAVRAVFNNPKTSARAYPAARVTEPPLTAEQRTYSARLMRINHAGEVCAQALYHSQALVSRSINVKQKMRQAALEEGDHLAWCKQRLLELGSHTSYLNPLWYGGSFVIGLSAGLIGDRWSLGFLAETEQQVVKHLEQHLQDIPEQDQKSYQILEQMRHDEAAHRDEAFAAGAALLPNSVKNIMRWISKVMVKTAYWV